MNDSEKRLDYGLLQAIRSEHNGHFFYMMAASNTEDPQGRGVFETLAAEELDHMRFLKAQYDSLKETGKVSPKAHLGSRMKLEFLGDSPIFSPEIRKRLGSADYEISALSIGIMLERKTLNLYEREAAAAINPEVAEFYLTLARWEQGHLDALIRQEEALKEDYWRQSDLYPGLFTNYRLQPPISNCLLRYAPSASSTYRRGYVCGVWRRKPSMQYYLGAFASKAGEKSGLPLVIGLETSSCAQPAAPSPFRRRVMKTSAGGFRRPPRTRRLERATRYALNGF